MCLKCLYNFYNEWVFALQNFMRNKKKEIDFIFSNKIVKSYENGRKVLIHNYLFVLNKNASLYLMVILTPLFINNLKKFKLRRMY